MATDVGRIGSADRATRASTEPQSSVRLGHTASVPCAFTPGPWDMGPWVDSAGGHVYRVITHEGRKVSAISVYGRRPDGSVGGKALETGGHTKTVSSEECDANARLIATAPSLYSDAEFLCARIRELEGELTGDDEASRQYFGHVLPAVARMESSLTEARGEHS